MASSHVFGIVELLETILLNLNCFELLRARHVCTKFRNVIETSPSLRKVIWLDPPREQSTVIKSHPLLRGLRHAKTIDFRPVFDNPIIMIEVPCDSVGRFAEQSKIPNLWWRLPFHAPTKPTNVRVTYHIPVVEFANGTLVSMPQSDGLTVGVVVRDMVRQMKEYEGRLKPDRAFVTLVDLVN